VPEVPETPGEPTAGRPRRRPTRRPSAQTAAPSALTPLVPPVDDLERLERLSSDKVDMIFAEWQTQMQHQRDMEKVGQRDARIIALTALVGSLITVIVSALTHSWPGAAAGGAIGTVDLVALAYIFIAGRNAPPPG